MAKDIVSATQPIGGDGATVSEKLSIDNGDLVADIQARYPLKKIIQPAYDVIDKIEAELLKVIPGDVWDKAILDPIFAGAKAQLGKLVTDLGN